MQPGSSSNRVAWLKGAKLVTWVQDLRPESLGATGFVRNPNILGAVSAIARWIYRKNDLLLVQSLAFVGPAAQMAGRFPPSDIPGILAQASALLVSLARDPIKSQTVPSKVQAHLVAGRPIIASLDGEGARVMAEPGAGVTCPAGDAQALAEAVRQQRHALSEERQRMAQCGRSYYEQHFEPNLLARRLTQIFAETVSGRLAVDTGTKNG